MTRVVARIRLVDADATRALGAFIGRHSGRQALIALSGKLGAGKTTLVQGIGEGLGAREVINSPTFTMMNEYTTGRLPLYHLDMYRLSMDMSASDQSPGSAVVMLAAEVEEIMGEAGVVVIEWAEFFDEHLPADRLEIHLFYEDDEQSTRTAEISACGPSSTRLMQKIADMFIYS